MEVLMLFTKQKEFEEFYSSQSRTLFLSLIVPYLKITEGQRDTMVDDPQEFCNAIEDTCGDQKSKTVKVVAAKLLCALSDNVQGFYT